MIPWIRTLIFSMNQNRKSQMRSRSTENCAKQLMALRLTCDRLADIATRQLSRTFRLSPYLESSFEAGSPWTKIRQYLYKWRASSQWIGSRQAVWGWKAPKRYYKKVDGSTPHMQKTRENRTASYFARSAFRRSWNLNSSWFVYRWRYDCIYEKVKNGT